MSSGARRSGPEQTQQRRSGVGGTAITVIVAIALAVAVWLGLFGLDGEKSDDAIREAAPADAGPGAGADTESVAAAGRVRVPGGTGDDARISVWDDFNRGGAGSSATVLDAPPSAGAAALELDGTGSVRGALSELGAGGGGADLGRPRFDVVRVAPDGSAVLAGRATPGAIVQVLVDGAPSETVKVDQTGEFVALLAKPSGQPRSGGARRIDLSAKNPDGKVLNSREPIIVTMPATPGEAPVAVRPNPDGGYEVLQPAAPSAESQVSVDAVTYGEKGEVVVTGRGEPGQTTRVYLDNSLKAETKVDEDGEWSARIEDDVEPARYRLRVDQMSPTGKVTGRAETPFERAAPADIRISEGAVIVQPGNNLWRIADYVYGDGARYTVIYGQNKSQIRDPDLIYPGQILALPTGG